MDYKDSILVFGCGPAAPATGADEFSTFMGQLMTQALATALLLSVSGRPFMVTCRHVVDGVSRGEVPKARSAGGGTVYVGKNKPHLHPSDNASSTRDVASFGLNPDITGRFPLIPVPVPLLLLSPLADNTLLEVFGYPLEAQVIENGQIEPVLKKVTARYVQNSQTSGKLPINYGRKVVAQLLAPIEDGAGIADFSGISGGLVLAVERGVRRPIGMVTGSATGQQRMRGQSESTRVQALQFITFAEMFAHR